jgi:hypothetical protein
VKEEPWINIVYFINKFLEMLFRNLRMRAHCRYFMEGIFKSSCGECIHRLMGKRSGKAAIEK